MASLIKIFAFIIALSLPFPTLAQDVFFIPRQAEEAAPEVKRPNSRKDMYARLRILEKATARSEEVILPPDVVVQHKKIKIRQKRCWLDSKGIPLEHAALLEIYGDNQTPSVALNFYGWLFKEQRSLTSFQHPYYDVTLLDCLTKEQFNATLASEKTPEQPTEDNE